MTEPTRITYSYASVPTLEAFSESDAFMRGILGPYGSGKSSACVVELVNRGLAQKPGPDGIRRTRFAVIRNSFPELRETTIKTIMQWFPAHYFGRYVESKHTYTIRSFPNTEIEIVFLSLDRPEDIKKLLSLELTGAWVNEAREIPWAIIEALQGRVGRYPAIRDGGPTWSGVWMDTNPPDSDSWWFRFYEERNWLKDFPKLIAGGVLPKGSKPEHYAKLFKQPSGLSPQAENLSNLRAGYYVNLSIGKSDEWKKIYIDGDYGFLVEGKAVYPEYLDRIHCQAVDPIPGVPIIRSYDWGLTPACAFSQILPDGRWLVFDEMVSDNMSADEFLDDVVEHCNRSFRGGVTFEDYGDPAGNQRAQTDKRTCFEIAEVKGINIQGSIQNPQLRQESVRKPLRTLVGGEPQFVLHPRCKNIRKGFMGGYHRRRLRTSVERYSEQVEKNQLSHCFPAGVLVSTPMGPRTIESLQVGDFVSTPVGPRAILAVMDRHATEIMRVKTRKGLMLPCTPDHPIWSNDLFVRADALKYGNVLWSASAWPESSDPFRNSMVSATTGSLRATTKPRMVPTCTGMSGNFIAAPFRMAFMSIIRTMTEAITLSRISTAYGVQITSQRTPKNTKDKTSRKLKSIWRVSGRSPRYGTNQTKGANGIESLLRHWRLAFLDWTMRVCDAGYPINLKLGARRLAIAPTLANRLLDANAGMTTKSAHASFAERASPLIGMPNPQHVDVVAEVSSPQRGEWRVYDLTIDEAHCFFANGILVSNCMEALEYGMVQYFAPALTEQPQDDDDFRDRGYDEYAALATRDEWTGY